MTNRSTVVAKSILNRKVIITCASTGAIHTPSMSQYLPITPDQIVEDAVGAAEAGASILHLHARDPLTGQPDQSGDAYAEILTAVKLRCDAIVNLTTGGQPIHVCARESSTGNSVSA